MVQNDDKKENPKTILSSIRGKQKTNSICYDMGENQNCSKAIQEL